MSSFTCSICTSSKKGAVCISLSCGHVFYRDWLNGLWNVYISDGDVERVGCPDPQCVKDGKEAAEEDIKKVVQSDIFNRWKDLYDNRTFSAGEGALFSTWKRCLHSIAGISPTYCPLLHCQALVPYVPHDDLDPVWKLFRECGNCGYSFCSYCLQPW